MKLEVRHFIDAGHILPDTEFLVSKGCAQLHGHTYAFIVEFEVTKLQGGMAVDFKAIKQIIDQLDHKTLIHKPTHGNYLEFLEAINPDQVVGFPSIPSSENIAKYIFSQIDKSYPHLLNLTVSVCEGYKGSERANWTVYGGEVMQS